MWIRKGAARVAGLLLAAAFAASLHAPNAAATPPTPPLEGANDWSCHPATQPSQRSQPVVLVHGSGTDVNRSFSLHADGYCVFAANLGATPGVVDAVSGQTGSSAPGVGMVGAALLGHPVYGVRDIDLMAVELAEVIESVRVSTGARQVALVGHSTGGTVIRQYARRLGGRQPPPCPADLPTYRSSTRLIHVVMSA